MTQAEIKQAREQILKSIGVKHPNALKKLSSNLEKKPVVLESADVSKAVQESA